MRARRKGTDSPFIEVDKVQLKDSDILFKAEVMEFQMEDNFDYLSTDIKTNVQLKEESHWQDIRERAAIAALTGMLADTNTDGTFDDYAEAAVGYADALVEKLKNK